MFNALPKRWINVTAPVCGVVIAGDFNQMSCDGASVDSRHLAHDGRISGE
jgi:hypothetical protein